jgi:WD40 repeat protein
VASCQSLRTIEAHEGWARAVAFSRSGERLASAGMDGTIKLWDPNTGALTRTFMAHAGGVRSVVFSNDDRRLISGGDDERLCVWDSQTGEQIRAVEAGPGLVWPLRQSADGRLLAHGDGRDERVTIWAADSLLRMIDLNVICGSWQGLALTPNGEQIAGVSPDLKMVRLCRLDGTVVRSFPHPDYVTGLAISPDGRYLATCCYDLLVRLWDVETGDERAVFRGHRQRPTPIVFSPNGEILASGGDDGTIWLWRAPHS